MMSMSDLEIFETQDIPRMLWLLDSGDKAFQEQACRCVVMYTLNNDGCDLFAARRVPSQQNNQVEMVVFEAQTVFPDCVEPLVLCK